MLRCISPSTTRYHHAPVMHKLHTTKVICQKMCCTTSYHTLYTLSGKKIIKVCWSIPPLPVFLPTTITMTWCTYYKYNTQALNVPAFGSGVLKTALAFISGPLFLALYEKNMGEDSGREQWKCNQMSREACHSIRDGGWTGFLHYTRFL